MNARMSVRTRLLSVILPVAALSIVLTAFVVQQITSDQLRDQVTADHAEVAFINATLNEVAVTSESWDDAVPVAVELATDFDVRIVLLNIEGVTLIDTAEILDHETRPLPTQSAGYIDPLLAAFDVDLPPEIEASIVAEEDFEQCLSDQGYDEASLDDLDLLETLEFSDAEEIFTVLDECWFDSFDQRFDYLTFDDLPSGNIASINANTFALEPALLFLGDPGAPTDVLDTSIDYRMVLAVIAIGSIAVLATYMVSRRILAPISTLTKAAEQVASGGRPEPVPVTGDSELFDLAVAFNSMGTTLRDEEVSRRQLTTDIAHELRSPLQNIRGTLEAAQDGIRDLNLDLIDSVHEEAIFLQHLVDDLQILALADAAKLHMESEKVDVEELVASVLRSQSARATELGINLYRSETEHGFHVLGDRLRLRQVLSNLVDNALRHTGSGGQVELELRSLNTLESGGVQICVRDTGEGIPEHFLPLIFDRFSRADPSRTRGTGGSGVGLAICQKLVEAHHGTISVSSEVGQGTTFIVELPTI